MRVRMSDLRWEFFFELIMGKLWDAYKYRFVPWIIWNLKHELKQQNSPNGFDPIAIDTLKPGLKSRIVRCLQDCNGPSPESSFKISIRTSLVCNGGRGVFNNGDVIPKHEFITLYPGTVYRPSDALFFQSIGNPYIFRCSDGIMVDGNNRGISRSLHKSLVSRHGPKARDVSWLGLSSSLAIGQIINNGGSEKCNVAYQELDFFDHTELDRKHIQTAMMSDFNFPFTPYSIQLRFMNELFSVLDQSKHGIFESPTGTGKSLSIICGALTWLRNFQNKRIKELQFQIDQLTCKVESESVVRKEETCLKFNHEDANDEPDWMKNFEQNQSLKIELNDLKTELERIETYMNKIKEYEDEVICEDPGKVRKELNNDLDEVQNSGLFDLNRLDSSDDLDGDLILDEYLSDEESSKSSSTPGIRRKYAKDYEDNFLAGESEKDNGDKRPLPQILFCSRTHSQLSQFIKELSKTSFSEDVTAAGMGARTNLCINKTVLAHKNSNAINEACLDMINKSKNSAEEKSGQEFTGGGEPPKKKRKRDGTSSCQFYKAGKMDRLRKYIVTRVTDIEDVVKKGKKIGACPYYATRFAAPSMHVLALPYQALLHKSTREAFGVSLKNNVVIIDEAHNLLESLASIQCVEITGKQFYYIYHCLQNYMQRFKTRLKSKNLIYIRQLLLLLNQCLQYLGGKVSQNPNLVKISNHSNSVETIDEFSYKSEIDNINVYKLLVYMEQSQICRKLAGYSQRFTESCEPAKLGCKTNDASADRKSLSAVENFIQSIKSDKLKTAENDAGENKSVKASEDAKDTQKLPSHATKCNIYQLKTFLETLVSDPDLKCKICVKRSDTVGLSSVKAFILNPAQMFKDVVSQSRSVVLAGGTMQPFDEFTGQLFDALGVNKSKIHLFTCGHIVNSSQLRTLILSSGPTNKPLQFSFKDRQNDELFVELGRTLCNVVGKVSGGCVVFFPSYDFESKVLSFLANTKMLDQITQKKPLFKESRLTADSDDVFEKYKKKIDCNPKVGAILFAVMGGKMSEGINFSDNYGRSVIVVGMPYPNSKSLELNAKMGFLNSVQPGLGQSHYENLCMKSVNQSIGRAIRHQNDYACVVLIDARFSREQVKAKLPGWIKESIMVCPNFASCVVELTRFFRDHNQKQ